MPASSFSLSASWVVLSLCVVCRGSSDLLSVSCVACLLRASWINHHYASCVCLTRCAQGRLSYHMRLGWSVLLGHECVLGQQSHPECVLGRLPHSVYLGISIKLSESWVVSVIGCRENRNQIYMLKLDRCQLCSRGFRNRLMTSMPESTRYS